MENKIVVRVYGICIKDESVLLSDERLRGHVFTKFPGGGLEFGEGTAECLLREMREETGLEFNILSHFYTTDFFQVSAFHKGHQIISIYYLIDGPELHTDQISLQPLTFKTPGDEQLFRWEKLRDLSASSVTFPIDKKVVELLKIHFS